METRRIPIIVFVLLAILLCAPSLSFAQIRVFACEPEWAALAEEIGGDRIKAFSATSARQDPHYIRAKPSLLAKIRKADLLICSGASLEVGWLPILLQKAKASLQPGSVGYLMAADIVPTLERPQIVDRSLGDIHPQGNPHLHLNPRNMDIVGVSLAKRLGEIDAENASFYNKRQQDFSLRLREAVKKWESKTETLKGKRLVVHHKSFSYLIDWLQMERIATLEPRPGIPPTASHLKNLLSRLKNESEFIIINSPYDPNDASEWLSEKTGAMAITLPYTIGGDEKSNDIFALFERTIDLLKSAYDDRK